MGNSFTRDLLVQVEDPWKAVAFYEKNLGFEVTKKTLAEAGCQVVIWENEGPRRHIKDPFGLIYILTTASGRE